METTILAVRWIVVYGNPSDGFRCVGVFDDTTKAIEWAQDRIYTECWWIVELTSKAEFEKENA